VVGVAAPRLPGAARAVLESFGVTAAPLREALVASMGDPYEPHHRGILFSAGPQLVLERANLEALVLADAEVASEHVLLALTARWDGSFAASWLQRCGIDPVALRQRVVEFTEGGNPVLTADGRPVHGLVDEQGQQVLDGEGRPLIGAVEIPPGCRVRAHHERE
jgi:ATP-dependent Clp protease ATP-binding subunit ClpA